LAIDASNTERPKVFSSAAAASIASSIWSTSVNAFGDDAEPWAGSAIYLLLRRSD
jgi:hypothetical protein